MPISGLVVTLGEDPHAREFSLAAMRNHPALEVGEFAGGRIPVVVESSNDEEDRLIWEWLHSLRGVAMVVVAFISFNDDSAAVETSATSAGFLQEDPHHSMDRES